jgi:hypothetical protein
MLKRFLLENLKQRCLFADIDGRMILKWVARNKDVSGEMWRLVGPSGALLWTFLNRNGFASSSLCCPGEYMQTFL